MSIHQQDYLLLSPAMTPGERIRAAREAKGLKQRQVANRVGMSQQAYEAIEGDRTQRSKFLPRIARVLEIQLEELDPKLEAETPPHRIFAGSSRDFPVYASAEGGPGEIIRDTNPIDWAPRPAPLAWAQNPFGLYVVGESMSPEFEPGDIALINPSLPIAPDTTCIFYSEKHGEERVTIKRLIRQAKDKWHVRQWTPQLDFTLDRKEWAKCHRTVGKYSRR